MRQICILILLFFASFSPTKEEAPYALILGTMQDGGYPHIGCEKDCCKEAVQKNIRIPVSSIAIIDPVSKQKWIIDATPDFTQQLQMANDHQPGELSGIFLTHAHIGHYTGLMYLGREAMNAGKIPVYAMPRMNDYLNTNGPWSQLVTLNNIELRKLKADTAIQLNERISIQPFTVPHRDEFSETVGYIIRYGGRSLLYLPDIDKWNKWDRDIRKLARQNDHLLLDGTFYKDGELPGRNMSEIPHPFVQESMDLFATLTDVDKRKVRFIHFNHTNPLKTDYSDAAKEVRAKGFKVATTGEIIRF